VNKKLNTVVLILASIIGQACSLGTSTTSKEANSNCINQAQGSATSAECDPNYSGCVPIASDVDSAGGSGDGPAYVKVPRKFIGKDIYGLDSDGDGIGCE
jgi:hypothetical protein